MESTQTNFQTISYLRYLATMAYRGIKDFFVLTEKLPSEPIVIDNTEIKVWMVGHATILINFFGTIILTDPVLVTALPFPKRLVAHGYQVEDLPPLDYVVISHAHLDHCDTRTLRQLAHKTKTVVVPRACDDIVKGMPFGEIVVLDWNEHIPRTDTTISAYRPEHWGQRFPWEVKKRGFNCYVFERNGRAIFFGGDTGYGDFFKMIGSKHTIDIALLPISAYKPDRLRSHHMDPANAHRAFADLQSNHCIPIHWGSFRLALEAMDEPPTLFKRYAEADGVMERTHILKNGTSFCLNLATHPALSPTAIEVAPPKPRNELGTSLD